MRAPAGRRALGALAFAATVLAGLADPAADPGPSPGPFVWKLPLGLPEPAVPPDNPMSAAKVELGRHLFYDTRLSADGSTTCASCHRQELAFTDGLARAVGATGERHARSAMSLANVAYGASLGWAEPGLILLEIQALVPMFNSDPVELGLTGDGTSALARLHAYAPYRRMFAEAFPGVRDPITLGSVQKALAAFERTLLSGRSAWDRLVYEDDGSALSADARAGMRLFFSDRLRCSECHGGINLSGPQVQVESPAEAPAFHNTGLYDLDGRGMYPAPNRGVFERTGEAGDMGHFRAPTLRNIALTAPYMHDGSIGTLGEVLDHYAAGGRSRSSLTSPLLEGFTLSAGERAAVVAFLESLTDLEFVADPRFASPWAAATPSGRPRQAGGSGRPGSAGAPGR